MVERFPSEAVAPPPRATSSTSRGVVVALVSLLAVTAAIALTRPPLVAETSTLAWIDATFDGSLDAPMQFLDEAGRVAIMGPVFVALAATLFLAGRRRSGTAVLMGTAAALLSNIAIKTLVGRPRPAVWVVEVDSLGSYPSGHTLFVTVLTGLVVCLLRGTRWRPLVLVAGAVLCAVMGFSRLYLGEHFPSDVVASFCLGALIVISVDRLVGLSIRAEDRPQD